MYQLIKSTSFGGISVEESLSLSFLQEKMRKDFQEITKMKSVSASELSDKAAFIHAGAECYHWLIKGGMLQGGSPRRFSGGLRD